MLSLFDAWCSGASMARLGSECDFDMIARDSQSGLLLSRGLPSGISQLDILLKKDVKANPKAHGSNHSGRLYVWIKYGVCQAAHQKTG